MGSPGLPLPDLMQIRALAAALVLFALCAFTGATLRGRSGEHGVDFLVGYGAIAGLVIALGTLPVPLPLSAGALVVVVAAAVWSMLARPPLHSLQPLGRTLALALPLLMIAAALRPVQFDDYSHWTLNAAYLYQHDSFPRADMPASGSAWPGYPYAMPIWTWLVSLGSGQFVENAGRICSGLFLVAAAALLVEAIRQEGRVEAPTGLWKWGTAAAALLAVTALSPSFQRGHTLTGYPDTATSVAVAGLGWVGCRLVQGSSGAHGREIRHLLQFSLIAVLLVSLKQANLVLLAFLCGGLFAIAAFSRCLDAVRRAGLACAAALPAVAFWLAWREYTRVHIPVGDFQWLPLEQWRWDLMAVVARGMTAQALRVPVHFAVMLATVFMGVRAIIHRRHTTADALAILASIMFIAYTPFLFVTYIGADFHESAARTGASFHRYSTHLGTLGMLTIAAAFSGKLARNARHRGAVAAVTAGLLVLAAMVSVPLGWRHFIGLPHASVRQTEEFVSSLGFGPTSHGKVAVIAPRNNGFLPVALQYALAHPRLNLGRLHVSIRIFAGHPDPIAVAHQVANHGSIEHVVLENASREFWAVFGLEGPETGLAWLSRVSGKWQTRHISSDAAGSS